ncbi:MAG: hypothetical protein JJT87_19370 [Halomonas sp.]|nr:hypothetical protein [Halomonas sp.]MCC5904077.1 hypothetical protein [Halomonas sp.]
MKLNITTHTIGDDENDKRPLMAGGKVEIASAIGDLKAEVMEGVYKGRVIEAFAWFAGDEESARIHITETSTGYRLGVIEAIAMIDGKPCSAAKLPSEALWDMVPSFMEAAKKAGFYHFAQANDEKAAALFKHLDELPKIELPRTLVA